MKVIIPQAPPDLLQWRARTGADRWDELWEGVLHMPPMPNREYQELELALATWLRTFWAKPRGNRVYHQIHVALPGRWPTDYRIPDLLLLKPDRFGIDHNEYFEGAPTVVIEIRSPGDETTEKLTFYAQLGVGEAWVIGRDTKLPELHTLEGKRYRQLSPNDDAWLHSPATEVQFQPAAGNRLAIRIAGDPATHRILPDD